MPHSHPDLLPGTLDMLILRTLEPGAMHGYAIAKTIRRMSKDVFDVEQGSLYPALYRMERRGWLRSRWSQSETNRRVKLYQLTRSGRQQLELETSTWDTFVQAVQRVMRKAR